MSMAISNSSYYCVEFDPNFRFIFLLTPANCLPQTRADWLIICFIHFVWLLIMCLVDSKNISSIFDNLNGLPSGVFNVIAFSHTLMLETISSLSVASPASSQRKKKIECCTKIQDWYHYVLCNCYVMLNVRILHRPWIKEFQHSIIEEIYQFYLSPATSI